MKLTVSYIQLSGALPRDQEADIVGGMFIIGNNAEFTKAAGWEMRPYMKIGWKQFA